MLIEKRFLMVFEEFLFFDLFTGLEFSIQSLNLAIHDISKGSSFYLQFYIHVFILPREK